MLRVNDGVRQEMTSFTRDIDQGPQWQALRREQFSSGPLNMGGSDTRPSSNDLPLEIANRSHSYGNQPSYSNASLESRRGELLAFIGESDSGTAALLKVTDGLEQPRQIKMPLIGGADVEERFSIGAANSPSNTRSLPANVRGALSERIGRRLMSGERLQRMRVIS